MHLPSFVISDLKSRLSLSTLMDQEFSLQKLKRVGNGNSFLACCPFHDDKSPSLTIDDDGGIYHCFGCNEHGDIIDMYRDHCNLNFFQVIEKMCDLTGFDLESLKADLNSISSAPTAQKNRSSLPLTNLIFSKYSNYNPYYHSNASSLVKVPNTLEEMKFSLVSVNKLFDSNTGGSINQAIRNDIELTEIAEQLRIIDSVGNLTYHQNLCYLPTFSVDKPDTRFSPLPFVINDSSSDKQLHCAGFIVLNHNLELHGYYPESVFHQQSPILFPPPSQFDMVSNLDRIFITDTAEQYVDLVGCGLSNIVAPAYGELNHQHLRQMSYLPTKELLWVTTKDSLKHPQIISKLSIFAESLGPNKNLSFAFLNNNEEGNPFSTLVIDHEQRGIDLVLENKVPFEKVIELAIPTIEKLEGKQKAFAQRAVCQIMKKLLRISESKNISNVESLMKALSQAGDMSTIEIISQVAGLDKQIVSTCLDILDGNEPSQGMVNSIIELNDMLSSPNNQNQLLLEKIKSSLNDSDNLIDDLDLTSETHRFAYSMVMDVASPITNRAPSNTNSAITPM